MNEVSHGATIIGRDPRQLCSTFALKYDYRRISSPTISSHDNQHEYGTVRRAWYLGPTPGPSCLSPPFSRALRTEASFYPTHVQYTDRQFPTKHCCGFDIKAVNTHVRPCAHQHLGDVDASRTDGLVEGRQAVPDREVSLRAVLQQSGCCLSVLSVPDACACDMKKGNMYVV